MQELSHEKQLTYWSDSRHVDYHTRQFSTPYRCTVHLADFMESAVGKLDQGQRGLDVCCGMGANVLYLTARFPDLQWIGVDIVDDLLIKGRRTIDLHGSSIRKPQLIQANALDLSSTFDDESFKIVTSMQTLLCMSEPGVALDNLFTMCAPGGWIFISSLFTDSLVDVRMQISLYPEGDFARPGVPALYNVYCLERFKEECFARGAATVEAAEFEIDVDLFPPADHLMGTFTVERKQGGRLQISGPVLMPWMFVAIRKK